MYIVYKTYTQTPLCLRRNSFRCMQLGLHMLWLKPRRLCVGECLHQWHMCVWVCAAYYNVRRHHELKRFFVYIPPCDAMEYIHALLKGCGAAACMVNVFKDDDGMMCVCVRDPAAMVSRSYRIKRDLTRLVALWPRAQCALRRASGWYMYSIR